MCPRLRIYAFPIALLTIVHINGQVTQAWGLPEHSKDIDIRQQEVITEACTPQTAYIEYATCIPLVADVTTCLWASGLTTSTTVGCDAKNSTQSTTLASPTLTADCSQGGCGTCVSAVPSTIDLGCTNCTTVDGTIYGSQITLTQGQTPTLGSGVPTDQITARDAEPTASDKSNVLVRNIRKLVTRTINILKRTMPMPNSYMNHNAFMLAQVKEAKGMGMLVRHRRKDDIPFGRSSAKVNAFTQSPVTMAVAGLDGCTSIAVISRRGAWMSHLYEKDSFLNTDNFESDVLYGVFQGDDTPFFPGINQFSHTGESLFNGHTFGEVQNTVKIIIMTPRMPLAGEGVAGWDPTRPWKYRDQVQSISELLEMTFKNMLGVADVVPEIIAYKQLDWDGDPSMTQDEKDYINFTTASGKLVLQYDPWEYTQTVSQPGGGGICNKPWPAIRVYAGAQETIVWGDTWEAMPEQLLGNYNFMTKRDGSSVNVTGPICIKQPATNETCSACTSPGACDIGPDDDQGEDGIPPTTFGNGTSTSTGWNATSTMSLNATSLTMNATLASTTMSPTNLTTSFSTPSLSANTTTFMNITTTQAPGINDCSLSTLSSCTLTTLPTETAPDGQPYAYAPTSCACGESLKPAGRTKGSDGIITSTCDLNQICACPTGITASLLTVTGTDAKETYDCVDTNGVTQPVGTATTSVPLVITDCSLTSSSTGTMPGYSPAIAEYATICDCNGNQTMTASLSTGKTGDVGVYCGTGSAAILVTSMAGPTSTSMAITECYLTTTPTATITGFIFLPGIIEYATLCNCNNDQTMTASTSTGDLGDVEVYCSTVLVGFSAPPTTSTPTSTLPSETPTPTNIPFTNYLAIWQATDTVNKVDDSGRHRVISYLWIIMDNTYSPLGTVPPADPCNDAENNHQVYTGSTKNKFPTWIDDIKLNGHSNCWYTGADSDTVGHIECDDSYKASCVAWDDSSLDQTCDKDVVTLGSEETKYETKVKCDYHDTMVDGDLT